jgi:ribosomal-protein-alanine acetyltransferase
VNISVNHIVLRRAESGDASQLLDIEQEAFTHPHWDAGSLLRYDCTVAQIDGPIAGFLVSRALVPTETEILNLAVSERYRRRGIASALLRHELQKPGAHFLEVRESNTAALALYRKFGFEEVGRRTGYYEFPAETAIVMRMK